MEPAVERYIRVLRQEAEEAFGHAELVASAFRLCESAIERQLLLAYLQQYPTIVETTVVAGEPNTHVFIDKDMDGSWVAFVPQVPLTIKGRRFRPDFLFMLIVEDVATAKAGSSSIKNVVVEVDGHDFHERTKQQAQRDRSRDRFMLEHGFYVLRFTGSEVFHDAVSVAKQIRNFVMPSKVAA